MVLIHMLAIVFLSQDKTGDICGLGGELQTMTPIVAQLNSFKTVNRKTLLLQATVYPHLHYIAGHLLVNCYAQILTHAFQVIA